MGDAVGQRGVQIGQRFVQGLPRQRVHQVQIDVVEVAQRDVDGATRLLAVVNAAQRLQMRRLEALDANGQPVDAGLAVAAETLGLEGAGIGFHGDFRVRLQPHARARLPAARPSPAARTGWECRPHEDAAQRPAPDLGQAELQIAQQGVDIGHLVETALGLVRVEVAIRAFAHAPREMDVERQRRQLFQADLTAQPKRGQRNLAHLHVAAPCSISRAGRALSEGTRFMPARAAASSACSAWPRWLTRFFSAASISATLQPCWKCGS